MDIFDFFREDKFREFYENRFIIRVVVNELTYIAKNANML